MDPARLRHAAAGASALALLAGCGALPEKPSLADPDSLRKELQRTTGIQLREVERGDFFGNVPNVEATYAGGDPQENLLAVVFNSPKATRQPLGRRYTAPPRTLVVRERNVVVFYTRPPGGPDRVPQIRRAVRAS